MPRLAESKEKRAKAGDRVTDNAVKGRFTWLF